MEEHQGLIVEMFNIDNQIVNNHLGEQILQAEEDQRIENPAQPAEQHEQQQEQQLVTLQGIPIRCCTCLTETPIYCILACGHIPFCEACWLTYNYNSNDFVVNNDEMLRSCPVCRETYNVNDVRKVFFT
ncbi:uncharacterized protein LOC127286109 [Leptopilina boulardi]|uniref:uncharacterized protein LOC127276686 n=1 Tax=Leptopilina boulardi TaxID=63433 RepID=UPI0021F633FE|nr:uncharacterized protein LOC127276686 [Leptopilina boulardi]XP_051163803.1 uncharacterized protein LOC127283152 [Leptopilina boulardi]XP_051164863.1 uncharacterized protein LOC127283808 [Leptopilina boulardi]XP_051168371.1 uncharacterized protein LOC127286109 [Leptopilina boulardi]